MAPGESSLKKRKAENSEEDEEGTENFGVDVESYNSKKSQESHYSKKIEESESNKECEGGDEIEENDEDEYKYENSDKDSDSDSDSDFDHLNYPMDEEFREKFKLYLRQVKQSQGFDADLFPGFPPGYGPLLGSAPTPCKLDELYDYNNPPATHRDICNDIISLAIEDYNRLQETVKLELVGVVKATTSPSYYITFTAKDILSPSQKEKIFQVKGDKVCSRLPTSYAYMKDPNDPSYVLLSPDEDISEAKIYYFEED